MEFDFYRLTGLIRISIQAFKILPSHRLESFQASVAFKDQTESEKLSPTHLTNSFKGFTRMAAIKQRASKKIGIDGIFH